MTTTEETVSRTAPAELRVLSPNCRTALHPNVPSDFRYGHPACEFPGYEHPLLGWVKIACSCACHLPS
jgi:hypothetical protein